MAKKIHIFFIYALLIVVIFVAFIRDPTLNLCAENIRGYDRKTTAELNAAKSSLLKISAALEDENILSQPLEGLTPAKLGVLNAMDRQCKLLATCLRFSIFDSTKKSCPDEYTDYQRRVDQALDMLMSLSNTARLAKDVAQKAHPITENQKKLANLTKTPTSGATGGREQVLRVAIEIEQRNLRPTVQRLQINIDEFISHFGRGE